MGPKTTGLIDRGSHSELHICSTGKLCLEAELTAFITEPRLIPNNLNSSSYSQPVKLGTHGIRNQGK